MKKETTENKEVKQNSTPSDVNAMIDRLVSNAHQALAEYMKLDQEQVDKIVHAMTLAGLDKHMYLANAAAEETKRGLFEDKVIKNMFATEYIYHSIAHQKTVGVIEENDLEGYVEVAEPVGVVAGVTPVTNPTSTTMFKASSVQKPETRSSLPSILPLRNAPLKQQEFLRKPLLKNGAPKHCIQWIEVPSMEATTGLMKHEGVSLILATGGAGMVKSAYSCGKPALGVGPGNVPCYINKNVNVGRACTDLMISKTFDNGMICASEQAVIVDEAIKDEFEAYMKEHNCYFTNEEETALLTKYVMNTEKMAVNPAVVGQSAETIAKNAGLKVPAGTKILLARLPEPSIKYPLSLEKLSPVLAYFVCKDENRALNMPRLCWNLAV
jgi:acetaldehyde dehydrogenase/alcohol dehydrogenase